MTKKIYGLDKFKEYFKDFTENYIIVGGTATTLFLENAFLNSRSTKDIDMIIISDKLSGEFGITFWKFIKDGNYNAYISKDGNKHYYRFINKNLNGFPQMIELFCRKGFKNQNNGIFTPVIIGDNISSLSAILLDDDYYNFLVDGKCILNGLSLLDPIHLILFKAKAHVDLINKKNNGEFVNDRDSKKHKNDIFRLLQLLESNVKYNIPTFIKHDIVSFLDVVENEDIDVLNLTNGALSLDEALSMLKEIVKS